MTPEDYEPEGFMASDFEGYNYGDSEMVRIDCGRAHSVWHHITLEVKASGTMIKQVFHFNTFFNNKKIFFNETILLLRLRILQQ